MNRVVCRKEVIKDAELQPCWGPRHRSNLGLPWPGTWPVLAVVLALAMAGGGGMSEASPWLRSALKWEKDATEASDGITNCRQAGCPARGNFSPRHCRKEPGQLAGQENKAISCQKLSKSWSKQTSTCVLRHAVLFPCHVSYQPKARLPPYRDKRGDWCL